MVAYIHSISNQLNCAMYSEHNNLSSSAIDLITTLSAGLGPSFEPLISFFVPTLFWLCTRSKNASMKEREVKICLFTLVRNTPVNSFLPYIAHLDTSASLRLVAAEAILVCLNCESFEPPNLDTDTRGDLLEDVIKLTTRDGCTNVRRAGKEMFGAYKIVFPFSFIEGLSSAAREDLTSPLTPVVISCSNPTAGGVSPAASLESKKSLPARKAERQVHPLGSKLPRVIPAPKQAIAARQDAFRGPSELRSMPAKTNQRMGPACLSVPTTHGSHGNELRVGGRSLAKTVGASDADSTEAAPTIQKIRPPSLKPNSVGKSQITQGGPKRNATKIPVIEMKVQPFEKGERTTTGGSSSQIVKRRSHAPPSTEVVDVKASSQTCRRGKALKLPRPNKKAVDEKKLVQGSASNGAKSVVKPSKVIVNKRKLVRGGSISSDATPVLKQFGMKKLDSGKPVRKDISLPSTESSISTTLRTDAKNIPDVYFASISIVRADVFLRIVGLKPILIHTGTPWTAAAYLYSGFEG